MGMCIRVAAIVKNSQDRKTTEYAVPLFDTHLPNTYTCSSLCPIITASTLHPLLQLFLCLSVIHLTNLVGATPACLNLIPVLLPFFLCLVPDWMTSSHFFWLFVS